ncbi:hypothetical protein C8J56DRAFT_1170178 [Mycena floridula]|nr:hypothetical protein C8J56DRAFT_1170178 [Mycena floridula]
MTLPSPPFMSLAHGFSSSAPQPHLSPLASPAVTSWCSSVPSSDRCEAFLTVTCGHASGKIVMLLPTWCLLCFLLYCVSRYHRLLRVKLSCGSTCSRVSKPPDWHQEDQKVPYPDV